MAVRRAEIQTSAFMSLYMCVWIRPDLGRPKLPLDGDCRRRRRLELRSPPQPPRRPVINQLAIGAAARDLFGQAHRRQSLGVWPGRSDTRLSSSEARKLIACAKDVAEPEARHSGWSLVCVGARPPKRSHRRRRSLAGSLAGPAREPLVCLFVYLFIRTGARLSSASLISTGRQQATTTNDGDDDDANPGAANKRARET